MADIGRSFSDVLGEALSNDLHTEAVRIEKDRKEREALRKLRDAEQGSQTLTTSEVLRAVLEDGEKVAADVKAPPKKEVTNEPERPKQQSPTFPPPPTGR